MMRSTIRSGRITWTGESSRERERSKVVAREFLSRLIPDSACERSRLAELRALKAEFSAMALYGDGPTTLDCVYGKNGTIVTINGMPAKEWSARWQAYQQAYDAEIARYLAEGPRTTSAGHGDAGTEVSGR